MVEIVSGKVAFFGKAGFETYHYHQYHFFHHCFPALLDCLSTNFGCCCLCAFFKSFEQVFMFSFIFFVIHVSFWWVFFADFPQVLLRSFRNTSEGKVSQLCSSNWHTNLAGDLPKFGEDSMSMLFILTNIFQLAWNHEIANLDVSRCISLLKCGRISSQPCFPEGTFFCMTSSNTLCQSCQTSWRVQALRACGCQIDEVNDLSFTKGMEDRMGWYQ